MRELSSAAMTGAGELLAMSHDERVRHVIALGRRAASDASARAAIDELSAGGPFGQRLSLRAWQASGDGARVLEAVSSASRLVAGAARKLVARVCDDGQAYEALLVCYAVHRHRQVLQALHQQGRLGPIDRFLDHVAERGDRATLIDCVAFGSNDAHDRHLPVALSAPSLCFWDRMRRHAIARLGRVACEMLEGGSGAPDGLAAHVLRTAQDEIAERAPDEACRLMHILLRRGVALPQRFVSLLARRRPAELCDALLEHDITPPSGLFERHGRALGEARLLALLRRHRASLGSVARLVDRLDEATCVALARAHAGEVERAPQWGVELLRFLPEGDAGRERAYLAWSCAARDRDAVIGRHLLDRLPPDLAEREGRRHVTQAPQLETRPRERIAYCAYLSFDEASPHLAYYVGHPEGEVRGQAIAILLRIAGRSSHRPELRARALEMVIARKNEQDPVRLSMLNALRAWPRGAIERAHLEAVGQIVRHALDAADLSHATAQAAEGLVVSLFRLDGAWGARWLSTLIKERGVLYNARLGDSLGDDEVRSLAAPLLEVAVAWSKRERLAELFALCDSLGGRMTLVPDLDAVLEGCFSAKGTTYDTIKLLGLLLRHARPRYDALVARAMGELLSRRWSGVVLAHAADAPELVPAVVAAVEAVVLGAAHAHEIEAGLSALREKARPSFEALVARLVDEDKSVITIKLVAWHLHRRRQDLLTPYLGNDRMQGRFASGKTTWVLPYESGFFRWTPGQQDLFAAQLTRLVRDPERDTPTLLWSMIRLSQLAYSRSTTLIELADDSRPVVQEWSLRTLARLDAGQGVPKLLACLDDARARIAIYGLRKALADMPPAAALPLLKQAPLRKVTVAKEVVRLLGELRADGAFDYLVTLDTPQLHRDVRLALLRALWDHLDRDETWAIFRRAALGPDWVAASCLAAIPPSRLSPRADRLLSALFAEVLSRPEPEARIDLLRRAPTLPVRDLDATLLDACVARLSSRHDDEARAACTALLSRVHESQLERYGRALPSLVAARRALDLHAAQVQGELLRAGASQRLVARALLEEVSRHEALLPMALRLTRALDGVPAMLARARALIEQRRLHAVALMTVCAELAQGDIEELDEVARSFAGRDDEASALIALRALVAAASRGGYTEARRALLARLQQSRWPMVAGEASLTIVPDDSVVAKPAQQPPR